MQTAMGRASSRGLAEVLIFGIRGLKDVAGDALDMRRLIALQVDIVLAVGGEQLALAGAPR